MTRDEEIKSKANRFSCNSDEFYSFIHGAEWADKTIIDKACDWLKAHVAKYYIADFYTYDSCICDYMDINIDTETLINDFKKALEG